MAIDSSSRDVGAGEGRGAEGPWPPLHFVKNCFLSLHLFSKAKTKRAFDSSSREESKNAKKVGVRGLGSRQSEIKVPLHPHFS